MIPPESILQLCKSFYDPKDIRDAKAELFQTINRPDLCRLVKRQGLNAPVENLKDILKLIQLCPEIPVCYVAGDLSRLPPITFNDIDVSTLLAKMEGMQTEMRLLKETQQAQALLVSDLKEAACSATTPLPSVSSVSPIQSTTFSSLAKQMASTPKSEMNAMRKPAAKTSPPLAAAQKTFTVEPTKTSTTGQDRRIGTGNHALRTATYAKEGRPSEIFVSRLAPDVSCDDVKHHIKATFNLDATVECVRATNFHTSYHVSMKCQNPRRLINPVNWPEGTFVKWWRRPKNPDVISDNTMSRIPMPKSDVNHVITIDESSLESFHSAKENNDNDVPMGGVNITVTGSTPPPISDRTMGNIQYSLADLLRRSESDSDSSEPRFNSPVRSPTDLFFTQSRRRKKQVRKRRENLDTSVAMTRSRSRSNLNLPQDQNRAVTRSVSRAGLNSHQ